MARDKTIPEHLTNYSPVQGAVYKGFTLSCNFDTDHKPVLKFHFNKIYFKQNTNAINALLRKCGCLIADNKRTVLSQQGAENHQWTIFGNRGVEGALHVLLTTAECDSQFFFQNSHFKKQLQQLQQNIVNNIIRIESEKNQKPDIKKHSLKIAKKEKFFVPSYNPVTQSKHEVRSVVKVNHKIMKSYYMKTGISAITELETLNSELYILLLGRDRVARVRPICDDNGMRRGSVSRAAQNFQSLRSYMMARQNMLDESVVDKLISAGYGSLEVANLVYAENDAHWNNIYFNKDGKVSRIDFDQANWGHTCKYKGWDFDEPCHDGISPIEAFPVTRYDIEHLAQLLDAYPARGLYSEFHSVYNKKDMLLNKMQEDPIFNGDKWRTFLKYCLIPDSIFCDLVDRCVSSSQEREEILLYILNRKHEYRRILPQIADFRDYVLKHSEEALNVIDELEMLISELNSVENEYTHLLQDFERENQQAIKRQEFKDLVMTFLRSNTKIIFGEEATFTLLKDSNAHITLPESLGACFSGDDDGVVQKITKDGYLTFIIKSTDIESVFKDLNEDDIPLMDLEKIPFTLTSLYIWQDITKKLSSTKTLSILDDRHKYFSFQLQSHILNKCKTYLAEAKAFGSFGSFFKIETPEDRSLSLLCRAITEHIENIQYYPNIFTLNELMIVQQKRDFIRKCSKQIRLLCSDSNDSAERELTAAAYRTLLTEIDSSAVDIPVKEVIERSKITVVKSKTRKFFLSKGTQEKITVHSALQNEKIFKNNRYLPDPVFPFQDAVKSGVNSCYMI